MRRSLLIGFVALVAGAGCTTDPEVEGERPEQMETTASAPFPTTTIEPSTTATDTGRLATGRAPVAERSAACSMRSEADFGGAFADPENVVAGPFVLVGGNRPTTAGVVESHGGQKYPVLVSAGHRVTVRVPESVQDHISLGYGWLPQGKVDYADGYRAVTFVACAADGPSSSTAGPDEPVTFWSGFVFALESSCAPLDVSVDRDVRPHRIEIPLGASC